MPKMYIISGCNGSGKTTASYTLLPQMLDCNQFVNSDEFAKSLSPFDPSAASVSASRYMLMKYHFLLNRSMDFGIETTLATRALLNMVKDAQAGGYEVTILYFWLNSPELAIARVRNRVSAGGHNIPDEVIRRRYTVGLQYLFKYYIPACDRWIIADNSRSPFTVVAEGTQLSSTVRDAAKYELIRSLGQAAEPSEP
ncbi:MAG: zeta toxin family protein [Bacteroidales bacterium]|nr:zeta toxin family protein [Bacteroidales bacterium]MBP5635874.1 zeta toxin family protein [Bacteroidales bacterium]